jgi:hypothetical protein
MFRTAAFLLCTLFAAPLAARAGSVLVTPPALVSNDSVICVVSFLGDESTTATATLRDASGGLVSGGEPHAIDPGLSSPATAGPVSGWYYCTFEGLRKGMRGYLVVNEGGQSTLVLPASR